MTEPSNRDLAVELWRFARLLHEDERDIHERAAAADREAERLRDEARTLSGMSERAWEVLRTFTTQEHVSVCARGSAFHVLRFCRERYSAKLPAPSPDDDRR